MPALYQYFVHLADGVIAIDGGPMHLAHALGKPMVAIFATRWRNDGMRRGRMGWWFPIDADPLREAAVELLGRFDQATDASITQIAEAL